MTPGTALAYDSNTEMVGTRLDRKVTLSAIRLLTLPDTNPAGKLTKHALGREVKMPPLHATQGVPLPGLL